MRMAFFFDQTKCMGCSTCVVSCKDYYNVNPGKVSYRKQEIYEQINGEDHGYYSLSMSCNHCEDPACIKACTAGAITKRADGIVLVDRSKCINIRSCVEACPYNSPGIADSRQEPSQQDGWSVEHPMQKCTMCAELLDKGETPICVRNCPTHALEVGDYDELLAKHAGAVPMNKGNFPYAYVNNETETGPSFLIKPKSSVKVY